MNTEHKIITHGRDRQIVFPRYCVSCNAPANGRVPVQKIFKRVGMISGGGHDGTYKVVASFNVPFCHACIDRHKQEAVPLTWRNWLMAFFMGGMLIVPAVYIFLLSLNLWRDFLLAVARSDLMTAVIYGPLCVLSLVPISMLFVVGRQLSRPYLVIPPTSITSAIDFSDRDRTRTFRFRHEGYAERFRQANREHLGAPKQSHRIIPWRWIFRLLLLGMVTAVIGWLMLQGVL